MQNKIFNGLEIAVGHTLRPLEIEQQIIIAIDFNIN